jgi:hypothetical protein
MLLPGLTLGSPWPERADGRVGGVFRRACHVEIGDGSLLVLTTADLPHLPRALKLLACEPFDRLFRPGAAFRLAGGLWRTGGLAGSIRDVAVWQPPVAGNRASAATRRERLAEAASLLASRLREHPGQRLSADLAALVARLGAALEAGDGSELGTVAEALIGRGQGLTPSGDDVLVGCLAGLARRPGGAVLRDRLAEVLRPRLAATGPVSRHYLGAALDGLFSEPLAVLADAVDAARPGSSVRQATGAMLAIGASSGADGLAGLLAALSSDFTSATGPDHGSLQ